MLLDRKQKSFPISSPNILRYFKKKNVAALVFRETAVGATQKEEKWML
jgi:hypothetical protein